LKKLKAVFFFLLYSASFFLALGLHYERWVYFENPSKESTAVLAGILFFSGICLGFFIKQFKEESHTARNILYGVFVTLGIFMSDITLEKMMSERILFKAQGMEQFSVLRDHCGVHAGRTILILFYRTRYSQIEARERELALATSCRLEHYKRFNLRGLQGCTSGEDPLECRIQWITAFGERGLWDFQTRKFFYDEMKTHWADSKKEDAWVSYLLKDQELQNTKLSFLSLLGLASESDQYHRVQEEEDLKEMKLTELIFRNSIQEIPELMRTNEPSPASLKFKETWQGLQAKISHIPELEKELQSRI